MVSEEDYKRLKRYEVPNHARLLNFSCFGNLPLLSGDRTRRLFVDALVAAREQHGFRLWAFVVMPDHVHLLVWPRGEVPAILRSLKQSVARRFVQWAKQHDPASLVRLTHTSPSRATTHRFWQRGGGYDRNLWEPQAIWKAIDDIHMNPVKAGLCQRPQDWRWSSAAAYLGDPEPIIRLDRDSLPPKP